MTDNDFSDSIVSEFRDYRPHVTVDKVDFDLPEDYVMLGAPVLWWGEDL